MGKLGLWDEEADVDDPVVSGRPSLITGILRSEYHHK
jgi:hypothetical protein